MSRKTLLILATIPLLALFTCWLVIPCIQVSGGGLKMDSQSNLHNIGIALHSYCDDHKRLPPAIVYDKNGKPLYSWRVLLLPYFDFPRHKDAPPFNLEEPWDSVQNKKCLESTPYCYATQSTAIDGSPGTTHYQVLVGPGTAFERPLTEQELFSDKWSYTFLVVEAKDAVLWSKPVDLNYDPQKPLPAFGEMYFEPVHFMCRVVDWKPGFNALFASGKVRFIRSDTEESIFRVLATHSDIK